VALKRFRRSKDGKKLAGSYPSTEGKVNVPTPSPVALIPGSPVGTNPEEAFNNLVSKYEKNQLKNKEIATPIVATPTHRQQRETLSPRYQNYDIEVQELARRIESLTHDDIIKLGAAYDAIHLDSMETYLFSQALQKASQAVNLKVEEGSWGLTSLRTRSLGSLPDEVNEELRVATGFKPKYLKYKNRGGHKKWNTLWNVGDRASIMLYATMAAVEAKDSLTHREYYRLTEPTNEVILRVPKKSHWIKEEEMKKIMEDEKKIEEARYPNRWKPSRKRRQNNTNIL